MELYDHLHRLVEELGPQILDDSDNFRGALDDYLDEGTASTGEINVLVDTVRLGAYQRFNRLVASGVQPQAAVAEAGDQLSRDRGTADVAGSRWACAVLAYATDRVSAAEVQRYRTTSMPAESPEPTAGPPVVSPWSPPPTAARRAGGSGPTQDPAPTAAAPTGRQTPSSQPGAGGPQGYPQQPAAWGPAVQRYDPPPRRRYWPTVLIVAGVVVALIAAGIWWGTRDDSGADQTSSADTTDTTSGPTTSDPPPQPPSTDLDAVAARYDSLGRSVVAGASSCAQLDPKPGQEERLTCAYPDTTLELADYASSDDFERARARITGLGIGAVLSFERDGVYYLQAAEGSSLLYWDNTADQQSGTLRCRGCVGEDDLPAVFADMGSTVEVPTSVEDPDLRRLMAVVDLVNCTRIPNNVEGTTERHVCRQEGFTFYFAHFQARSDFVEQRDEFRLNALAADGFRDTWQPGGDDPRSDVGNIYAWVDVDDGLAHIYWNDLKCHCYGLIIGRDDNLQPLWTRGWNCESGCG